MLIPRRDTEPGDRRQHAQQTSMIASHAGPAGSSRSEAAATLRYHRWPRPSREIRPLGADAGSLPFKLWAVLIWASVAGTIPGQPLWATGSGPTIETTTR